MDMKEGGEKGDMNMIEGGKKEVYGYCKKGAVWGRKHGF